MTVQDLMDFYGCKTQSQLCEKIQISRVALWKWKKQGIPFRTQASFEVKTNGELKADQTKTPSSH
ncbi:hypothetical protein LP123_07350 [Moraxella bovis]|uniref:Cro/Cl family transcriptional regulator n=1 Tax=Moraxella bovis TaxID=476 RepID=A0ABY6MBE3_MORBO|nr:hypothetical protein [Moraxella bovis]UYZ80283.1 hypothetical protein LP113_09530 [Moraxella bovis]UZA04503.1 hypothetical protein LP092_07210 [Moraxella bovis]UZA04919.1 hypothetical protein LP099_06935 [Moraxella bovis]UZA05342.1 hypothetical protein LP099_09225 [Moraxella bovis]UZA12428.1 hypothetical protein LP123_05085 [Moraxella bovis]